MDFNGSTTVADLAARHPLTIRVFEKHRIDFCCGGQRPLSDVCAEQGLSLQELQTEIESALVGDSRAERDWSAAPAAELIDHILGRYHARLREDLPALTRMSEKVATVHGGAHPETREVAEIFGELRDELEPHMMKEEQVLFPLIRALGSGASHPMLGLLQHPVHAMQHEHEAAGAALARLRQLTDGYALPEDACNTYRGLYQGLAELERDLHRHIHLENNVLFPRALELEQRVLGSRS